MRALLLSNLIFIENILHDQRNFLVEILNSRTVFSTNSVGRFDLAMEVACVPAPTFQTAFFGHVFRARNMHHVTLYIFLFLFHYWNSKICWNEAEQDRSVEWHDHFLPTIPTTKTTTKKINHNNTKRRNHWRRTKYSSGWHISVSITIVKPRHEKKSSRNKLNDTRTFKPLRHQQCRGKVYCLLEATRFWYLNCKSLIARCCWPMTYTLPYSWSHEHAWSQATIWPS